MSFHQKYIFNDLYVIENLKKGIIPPEYSNRIIIMKSQVYRDDFCYFDKETGERYKYVSSIKGWDCETLVTSNYTSYIVEKYTPINAATEKYDPIYKVNDERVSRADFEKYKKTRTAPYYTSDFNKGR